MSSLHDPVHEQGASKILPSFILPEMGEGEKEGAGKLQTPWGRAQSARLVWGLQGGWPGSIAEGPRPLVSDSSGAGLPATSLLEAAVHPGVPRSQTYAHSLSPLGTPLGAKALC